MKTLKKKFKIIRNEILNALSIFLYELNPRRGRIVNEKEIIFTGLQRSGNHAVVNWIFSQSPEKKCYLNWIQPGTNPFHTFEKRGTVKGFQENFHLKFNITLEKIGRFSKKALIMYSYEDEPLENIFSSLFEKKHDRWIGVSRTRYNVLLLRDPFNLFASRLKKEDDILGNKYSLRNPEERKILCGLWKEYAREYLGETSFMKHNKIVINYNSWFLDHDYRQKLASNLNLDFTDEGMDKVLHIGGGSSFDRLNYNQHASQMKVLERWKHYKDDLDFKSSLKDDELISLYRKIFEPNKEIEDFIASVLNHK